MSNFLRRHLPNVSAVTFDSKAGRRKWLEAVPGIESNSLVINPGIEKDKIFSILKVDGRKYQLRKALNISEEHAKDDAIFL